MGVWLNLTVSRNLAEVNVVKFVLYEAVGESVLVVMGANFFKCFTMDSHFVLQALDETRFHADVGLRVAAASVGPQVA